MSKRNKKMKLRRNAATIGTYFIFILLWMNLVISAREKDITKIITESENVITEAIQQNVVQPRVIETCEGKDFFANDVVVSEGLYWCWFVMLWSLDAKKGLAMHVTSSMVTMPFEKGFYTHYGFRGNGPTVVGIDGFSKEEKMVHQPLGKTLDWWLSTFEGKNQELEIFIFRRDPKDIDVSYAEFVPFYEGLLKKVRNKFEYINFPPNVTIDQKDHTRTVLFSSAEFQNCYFIRGLVSCVESWNIKCQVDVNGTVNVYIY